MSDFIFGSYASGFRLPATGYRLPATGYRLPASGFRLPASGFRLPASGCMGDNEIITFSNKQTFN
ncbi:MAG: hypothetical protein IPJ86_01410 [Bacteroidetes bacterium]|nr:hypothetical protein [Bacteroidota bacterium]